MAGTVGIDVHKATLVLACHPSGETWTSGTTPAALTALSDRLRGLAPEVIVRAPSGGDERPVIAAVQRAKLPVARINGERIRSFARQRGIRAKADRLDAKVLAAFGAAEHPAPLPAQEATAQTRRDRITRRRQLVAWRTAEQHRRACVDAVIAASLDRMLAALEAELTVVEQQLRELVGSEAALAAAQAQYRSVPGLGATTAANLPVTAPELGQVSHKRIASLVGVAPQTEESGARPDHGHIQGGRAAGRRALWMPVLSMAYRGGNPVIAAFAARLRARGKPFHLVMIACMRKLLVILNAMRRDGTVWRDPTAAPA